MLAERGVAGRAGAPRAVLRRRAAAGGRPAEAGRRGRDQRGHDRPRRPHHHAPLPRDRSRSSTAPSTCAPTCRSRARAGCAAPAGPGSPRARSTCAATSRWRTTSSPRASSSPARRARSPTRVTVDYDSLTATDSRRLGRGKDSPSKATRRRDAVEASGPLVGVRPRAARAVPLDQRVDHAEQHPADQVRVRRPRAATPSSTAARTSVGEPRVDLAAPRAARPAPPRCCPAPAAAASPPGRCVDQHRAPLPRTPCAAAVRRVPASARRLVEHRDQPVECLVQRRPSSASLLGTWW